jgi:hypothetical protein
MNVPATAGQRAAGMPGLVRFGGPCHVDEERVEPAPVELPDDDEVEAIEREPARTAGELRLDEERAEPVLVESVLAGIVGAAAETMAMLAEHRITRPRAVRATREARILDLLGAVFATGEAAMGDVIRWSTRAHAEGDPWALWPASFALSLVDGQEGLLGLERVLEALPADAGDVVPVVANAVAGSPHPGLRALAEDLLEGPHPVARAVGIELLSRRGWLEVARARALLGDAAHVLVAAVVRALGRTPEPVDELGALLAHDAEGVVWEAARALALRGDPAALVAVRGGGAVARKLGRRAAEILVMAGEAADIALLEGVATSGPTTPELLDAIGRFGCPLAWSFLLHYLPDADLGEPASRALLTMFGEAVAPGDVLRPAAWRATLADLELDEAARYRAGRPWTPSVVAAELRGEGISQAAAERRIDELRARAGVGAGADLEGWASDVDAALAAVVDAASRARWRPGAWTGPRAGKVEEKGS